MVSRDVDDVLQEQQARASLYALLACFLLRPRDLPWAAFAGQPLEASVTSDASAHAFDDALTAAWQRLLLALRVPDAAEALRQEHAALFEAAGTPAINPYASAYLEGPLMSGPLGRVREDLARMGLQRAERAPEPEDHLGALCEAMQQLVLQDAEPELQLRFLQRHLTTWADRCLEDIAAQPHATLHRAFAAFASAYLAADVAALTDECEARDVLITH